jgi:hypothetical protein
MTTIIFSINVHENVGFLQKQIEDIEANVLLDFVVLINASVSMYHEIIDSGLLLLKANVVLYPVGIDKIHNHGTLTKGIYLNMKYAVRNYQFEYFVVLSSRNLFYNRLHKDNYHGMPRICYGATIEQLNRHEWHWAIFLQGTVFDYETAMKIYNFLDKNEEIKDDIFGFNWGVEEFALHTIAINVSGYYYQIGNWTNDDDTVNIPNLPCDRFVYKTFRR